MSQGGCIASFMSRVDKVLEIQEKIEKTLAHKALNDPVDSWIFWERQGRRLVISHRFNFLEGGLGEDQGKFFSKVLALPLELRIRLVGRTD